MTSNRRRSNFDALKFVDQALLSLQTEQGAPSTRIETQLRAEHASMYAIEFVQIALKRLGSEQKLYSFLYRCLNGEISPDFMPSPIDELYARYCKLDPLQARRILYLLQKQAP